MAHSPAASRGLEPLGVKVPEITALFWVVKLLTTAGGEAFSDYLSLHGHVTAGAIETLIFVVALWCQLRTRRYVAAAYWFLALAIAIFGTGVADFMHLIVGIPYGGTTALWAVILAVVFRRWYRSEGTLSIHSITTRRRELYYWATVFATFALGTALGDFTAAVLHLGYFGSAVLFAVVIMIPLIAWRSFGMNSVLAFWFAYVVTRPLGASFADWFGKPRALTGLDLGEAPVSAVFIVAIVALVGYLTVTRSDVQPGGDYQGYGDYPPVPEYAVASDYGYRPLDGRGADYNYAPDDYRHRPDDYRHRPADDYGRAAGPYGRRDDYGQRTGYDDGNAPTQSYQYRPRPEQGYSAAGREQPPADYGWEERPPGYGRQRPGDDPRTRRPGDDRYGRGRGPGDEGYGRRRRDYDPGYDPGEYQ